MDSNSVLTFILSDLQQKSNQLNRFYEITKDMEEVCTDKDEAPFVMLLNSRQSIIDSIDQLDGHIKEMLLRLPPELMGKINEILFPKGGAVKLDNPLHTNIYDTNKRNNLLLRRIIEVDERLHKKVNARLNL